jgi:hypothetical protein
MDAGATVKDGGRLSVNKGNLQSDGLTLELCADSIPVACIYIAHLPFFGKERLPQDREEVARDEAILKHGLQALFTGPSSSSHPTRYSRER